MYRYTDTLPPSMRPESRPEQFTPAEADILRRIARKEIERLEGRNKQQRLEKLAEELGYELTPIGESEE